MLGTIVIDGKEDYIYCNYSEEVISLSGSVLMISPYYVWYMFGDQDTEITGDACTVCNGNTGDVTCPECKGWGITNIQGAVNGVLHVEYTRECTNGSYDAVIGDNKTSLESNGTAIAEVTYPGVGTTLFTKIRRVVNNIEVYLGLKPTCWIGGSDNNARSTAYNILDSLTPMVADQIGEMQTAILVIRTRLRSMVEDEVDSTRFTTVSEQSPFVVQYIEEIIGALIDIESVIMVNQPE
jgi:uncharacterized protein YkuJ